MKVEKPTKSDIQTLLKSRESTYSELRGEQNKDNRYYEGLDDLGIPSNSGYHEVRTGIGRDVVEVPSRRLLGMPKDISLPIKAGKDSQARHTKRTLFITGFINWLFSQSPNPIIASFKKALLRGESYFQVLYDDTIWDTEPVRKTGEKTDDFEYRHEVWRLDCMTKPPFIIKSPDPMNVYPSSDHYGAVPRDVIIKYSRTAGEIRSRYPKWGEGKKNPKNDGTRVSWVEYWSPLWRAYYADWEPVLGGNVVVDGVIPNIYKFVPFVHMFSGFGIEDPEGKPETLARSAIYQYRSLITALQRSVSFQDSDVALHSHRTGKVTADNLKEAIAAASEINLAPGGVRAETPDGPKFELDDPVPLNPSLFAQSAYLQGLIEQRTHISLLSGSTTGAQSGIQQGMALGWARADYEQAIRNQESGLSGAIGMVLRLIDTVVQKPIGMKVAGEGAEVESDVSLSADDIKGYYTVKMKFQPEDKAASDVKKMTGLQALDKRIMGKIKVLRDYWDDPDPQGTLVAMWAEEEVENNPILRMQRNRMAAREWGIDEAEILEAEQAAMAQKTPALYGPQGQPMSPSGQAHNLPVRQYRRGLEQPEIEGGPGNFPLEEGGQL